MMDMRENLKRAGTFTIAPGKDVYGELTLAGQNTSLYLQDKEFFNTFDITDQCMNGVLHDLTKVSLIQCITKEGPGSANRGKENYHFARMFPHYVVQGNHHISPNDKVITEIHFVVDDASTLFYDFDAFGNLIDARPFIEQIAHANGLNREITIGPNPEILYFTGKREIFSADTVLGRVSASHNPTKKIGGPHGVGLKNTIVVTIAFKEVVTFHKAISSTSTLLNYFGLLVGRPQNLLKLYLCIERNDEQPPYLDVYWSMPPKREPSHEGRRPQPGDILLDAVRQQNAFSYILRNWLDRQHDWHDARFQFFNSFANQNCYDIDRLTGSANMFDILPSSAVPHDVRLSEDMNKAKTSSRIAFEQLPQSPERESVLSALGRVGKSNLKHKIRHRCQIVIDAVGERFSNIVTVTDEAVNCRNHYIHGSKPKFDYSNNFDTVMFLADTLEFVFAASDLIEAGWDIKTWCEQGTTMSHPFGQYRVNYAENVRNLKVLLPRPAVS